MKKAAYAVVFLALLFLAVFVVPRPLLAGDGDLLPFEAGDTLEEIRYKIETNGYDFTVAENWVSRMSPEEKERFFSRRAPLHPRPRAGSGDIGSWLEEPGKKVLPSSFDWRNYNGHSYIGSIKDQGTCGSCYAFAACAAAEGAYNFALGLYNGNCADFSESYIIWCLGRLPAYNSHFYGCGGSDWDYYELTALTVEGVGDEADFPYTVSDPGSCTHWGDQTTVFQSWHRIDCNDIDAIKTAIMTYGVIDVAVYADSAFQVYSGGVFENTDTTCPGGGAGPECYYTSTNHAVALVGWNDNGDPVNNGYWILRNSWGTDWGESGYMRIKYTSARVACEATYLVYQPPLPPATPSPTPEGYKTPIPTSTPAGQPVPFSEGFEDAWSGGAPALWTKEYVSGSTDWIKASGGLSGNPAAAHGGTYNALLCKEDWSGPVTRLISPRLDFASRTNNARLIFWHAMQDWSGDQDELAVCYRTSEAASWTSLTTYNSSVSSWTQRTISLPNPGNGYYISFRGTANWGYGVCIDDLLVTGDQAGIVLEGGDYNGDGTSDIAVFRPTSGLWSVRGVTRVYFGASSDTPVSGDYNGNGTAEIGIFRASSGLWSIRNITRVYFGSSSDLAAPGDYNGDGRCDPAVFRGSNGLWAVRDVTRVYFGSSSDTPVPGDYNGNGRKDIAVFRPGSGLWAARNVTRVYFGGSGDTAVPGDYNGDGTWEAGIFRPSSGLWSIRGVTRAYFGSSSDRAVPADYDGDSRDDTGIFRDSSGLWAIRGISRVYFGASGDIPVTR